MSEVPEKLRIAQPLADAPGGERFAQVGHGLCGLAAVVAGDRVEAIGVPVRSPWVKRTMYCIVSALTLLDVQRDLE